MTNAEIMANVAKLNESQKKVFRAAGLNSFAEGDTFKVEPIGSTRKVWVTIKRGGFTHIYRMGPRGAVINRQVWEG